MHTHGQPIGATRPLSRALWVCLLMTLALCGLSLSCGLFALLLRCGVPTVAATALTVAATVGVLWAGHAHRAGRLTWREGALGIAAWATALRLIYGAQVELLPEETYYWNYAQHLDIGYLDHPPLVAWLIRIGTALFGNTEIGVRAGAIACGAAAAYFSSNLARHCFGEASRWGALVLTQLLPFFFLSGMLMTPDAPLTACWAGALYFLERALIAEQPRAWLWAGVCLGLGLLSKYTIGLLGVSVLLFMIADPQARRWFRRWEPYAAAAIALLLFTPVIAWNAEHEWGSFAFQTARRLADRPQFSLPRLLGGALVLITPTGVVAVTWVLLNRQRARFAALAGPDAGRSWRLMRFAVLTPLAVYGLFSLRHEVKLDWTGAPWSAALPLVAGAMVTQGGAMSRAWLRTFPVLGLIYAAGLLHLALGIPGLGYARKNELLPAGWRDLGAQVGAIAQQWRERSGQALLVVGMDRYAIASELAFYSADQAQAVAHTASDHLFDGVGLMYEQWFAPSGQKGRTLLLVAFEPRDLAAERLISHVGRLDPLMEGTVSKNDRRVRRFYYRMAYDYR